MDSLKYKKFRLEISSWYMKEKEAYNFLKDTLSNESIERFFDAPRGDNQNNANRNSQISQEARDRTKEALSYFLSHMDEKYLRPTYPYKKNHELYD